MHVDINFFSFDEIIVRVHVTIQSNHADIVCFEPKGPHNFKHVDIVRFEPNNPHNFKILRSGM